MQTIHRFTQVATQYAEALLLVEASALKCSALKHGIGCSGDSKEPLYSLPPSLPPSIEIWMAISWQERRQHHRLPVFYLPVCTGQLFLGLKAGDRFTGRGESPTERKIQETAVSLASIFWILDLFLIFFFFF